LGYLPELHKNISTVKRRKKGDQKRLDEEKKKKIKKVRMMMMKGTVAEMLKKKKDVKKEGQKRIGNCQSSSLALSHEKRPHSLIKMIC